VTLLERYRDRLLAHGELVPISLGEGGTPLIQARRLGAAIGLDNLYLKFEGTNPTGSFKDRGMVLAVNRALGGGARAVVCASTGNTSASAAAYAAAAGMTCLVVLPAAGRARKTCPANAAGASC
jgi:threonine synthase